MHTQRRQLLLLAALPMTGCAALRTISAEVRSFGQWPQGRAATSYAFERLPSQQEPGSRAAEWEALAAPALAKAGFRPAPVGDAEFLVSLGVRISATELGPWHDPLWQRWYGPLHPWRRGLPLHAHPLFIERNYEREVGLLLRERASGQAIYEARASSDGATPGGDALIAALFEAALADFPKARPQAHTVRVMLP